MGIEWTIQPAVAGCAIDAGYPQVLSCSFGDLAPDESRSITVRSTTSTASCGVYGNTAVASATGLLPVTASASINQTCPPPPTGLCEGGVSKLVVKYTGTQALNGTVRGQRRNPGTSPILNAITQGIVPNTLYTFAIMSMGGQFGPVANGRLANNFKLFIGSKEIVDFHTSCSTPIYPGMKIGPVPQQFEIVEVWSLKGGKMGAPQRRCTSRRDPRVGQRGGPCATSHVIEGSGGLPGSGGDDLGSV